MSNQLTTFDFNALPVRVVEREGEPWFLVRDVCDALGISNVTDATRNIKDDRKLRLNLGLPGRAPLAVSEAGLYDLVLQSRKPEAVKFKEWVTGTVLPAIRKDGGYVMGEEKVVTGEMFKEELILHLIGANASRRMDMTTGWLKRYTL
ncbi:BRO-N domain-containing protein [Halomonas marinisediminis]|uniref:BRO domain-containing protein n=1 Tax=Halomonas marinisediminis TaxID=2546095 RepID=A0ABY2D4G5_9GAMM|nr:BRO family protein [Halomonas marinisediminis]TDB00776.1 BRO domain-containing protein [Halomonas marinisediminis]